MCILYSPNIDAKNILKSWSDGSDGNSGIQYSSLVNVETVFCGVAQATEMANKRTLFNKYIRRYSYVN